MGNLRIGDTVRSDTGDEGTVQGLGINHSDAYADVRLTNVTSGGVWTKRIPVSQLVALDVPGCSSLRGTGEQPTGPIAVTGGEIRVLGGTGAPTGPRTEPVELRGGAGLTNPDAEIRLAPTVADTSRLYVTLGTPGQSATTLSAAHGADSLASVMAEEPAAWPVEPRARMRVILAQWADAVRDRTVLYYTCRNEARQPHLLTQMEDAHMIHREMCRVYAYLCNGESRNFCRELGKQFETSTADQSLDRRARYVGWAKVLLLAADDLDRRMAGEIGRDHPLPVLV